MCWHGKCSHRGYRQETAVTKRAAEIMTREVVCVTPATRANEALELMRREAIRHLPVLSGGILVGVLSDRDLLPVTDEHTTVDAIMTRAPVTCSPKSTVGRLADLMVQHRFDSIPIVSDGELVGIVTSVDLLMLLVTSGESLAAVLPFDFSIREFRGSSPALPP
jgi:IMP dehydrogenase